MRKRNNALDVVQLNRDSQIIPEGRMPRREARMDGTDGPAGDDELAVAVTHIIGAHIAKATGGETRIDAIHQHRFIITACGRSLAAKQ